MDMKFFITLFLTLTAFGCTSKLDTQVLELINGKNLWLEKVKGQDYSYDIEYSCFCLLNKRKLRVSSNFNEAISAKIIDDKKELISISKNDVESMQQQFKSIFRALEEQEANKDVSVNVKYDKNFGYPSEIKYKGNGTDNFYTLKISNVKVF